MQFLIDGGQSVKTLTLEQRSELFEKTHTETITGKTFVEPDFRFREPNLNLCKMLGMTAGELSNTTFTEITPKLINEIDVANARLVAEGKLDWYLLPKIYEVRGKVCYALISVHPVKKNGEFQCYHVEISELNKTEYMRMTKEILGSHPALLESQYSWIAGVINHLSKLPLTKLYKISLRVGIFLIGLAAAAKESREKFISLFLQ